MFPSDEPPFWPDSERRRQNCRTKFRHPTTESSGLAFRLADPVDEPLRSNREKRLGRGDPLEVSSTVGLSTTGVGRQLPGRIEMLAGLFAIVTALRDLGETL